MMKQGEYVIFLCNRYMLMVHNFIRKWGWVVIKDVRDALNNVEENPGMTRTTWPTFLNPPL